MAFSETFHPDSEFSKIEDDARYLPTNDNQVLTSKEAGKYIDKKDIGNPIENKSAVSKIPDSQRGKMINDKIADQESAVAMMKNIDKSDATWPPINEIPNSIGINDTSSSVAKVNFGGTEGGKGNEVGMMNA